MATQKQLAGLLAPFHIISLTVHPPGLPDGKGYRRIDFEEAWAAYCPVQSSPSRQSFTIEASKRPNAAETGTTRDFRGVREDFPDGSKNANLSYNHAGLDVRIESRAQQLDVSFQQVVHPVLTEEAEVAETSGTKASCRYLESRH